MSSWIRFTYLQQVAGASLMPSVHGTPTDSLVQVLPPAQKPWRSWQSTLPKVRTLSSNAGVMTMDMSCDLFEFI